MENSYIMRIMSELSCRNCSAACCKGPETMELTADEHAFMIRGGSAFLTIAEPANHERTDVMYPAGVQVDEESSTVKILVREGTEFEPLAAGFGRFILWGSCGYLKTSNGGWEYCGAYDEKPGICGSFEMGGANCRLMRVAAGIDDPSEEFPDLRDLLT